MFVLLFLILSNFSSALSNVPAAGDSSHGYDAFPIHAQSSPHNIDNPKVANIDAEDLINPTNENAASQTHFLLMLDTSNAMASNGKLDHMKAFAINWLVELGERPGTVVAVVHYGNDATMMSAWVSLESALSQLVDKISKLSASGGDACTVCGLKMAELLMLEASDSKRTVLSITGQQDGSVGGSIADSSVWEPFKMGEIPIQTILYGIEGFALQVLTTETLGKYYSMMDYSRDNSALTDGKYYSMMDYTRDNSALTDVSKTFVPAVVGDGYEWVVEVVRLPGTCYVTGTCKADMMIRDSFNKNVKIYIRIASHDNIDIDVIDTIVITDESGNSMDGWNFSIDQMKNEIVLSKPFVEPGKYVIDISIKHHTSVQFILQVKVTADHTSTSTEPYIVECKHPTEMEQGQFLISSQVKQGYSNRVSGATVAARITLSLEDDPTGKDERPCFVHLWEDGLDVYSGDVASLDGVYSYILDTRDCFGGPVDNSVIERMTVICNMMASSDSHMDTFWE